MKFRYIGDSTEMQVFGYDFRDGATPEVTNPHALQKLSGNQFFEALPEEGKTGEPPLLVADVPLKERQKPVRKPRKR
jgi:hypothetical protein